MQHLSKTITGINDRGNASLFIDGAWSNGAGSGRLSVIAPHNEEELLSYAEASTADVDRAVAAARKAFDHGPWPRMSPPERGAILRKVAELLQARLPELAEAWTGQVGAAIGFTSMASHQAPGLFHYYAGLCETFPFVEERVTSFGGKALVIAEPAGVVAAITPWNVPLVLLSYKVAAALAAGCTIVAKPSPETPIEAHILAECIAQAGVPSGVFNMLPAGREIGDYLVKHPGVDKVSFTGSTAAGKAISHACADRLARVSLELGGKSAAIILDDANIDHVLKSLVPFSMPITGQVCFSLTRVLVPSARRDDIVEAYKAAVSHMKVGDPFESDTHMGPLTMSRQLERVQGYIQSGHAEGARLALGGGRPDHLAKGWFIEPTIFTDVTPDMTIFKEEIFGPVVSFVDYHNEQDMIEKANATNYGLHGAVYTEDAEKGLRIAGEVRTGSITVNGMIVDVQIPFGGFKQSGIGREGGVEGLKSYCETKAVYFA